MRPRHVWLLSLALIGALDIAWLRAPLALSFRLLRSGRTIAGVVTKLGPQAHSRVWYSYTVGSSTYEGAQSGSQAKVGDPVIVHYLPSDPTISTLKDPREVLQSFLYFMLGGACAGATMFAWAVHWWQEQKR